MNVPLITRPALRYLGGKYRLAPWIIGHFPRHRVYVEPFGGAASVLLRKPRSYAEIYNDLDGDLVNLFQVLRDRTQAAALIAALRLTPYSRTEFLASYRPATDTVERARQLVVRSWMGFGSNPTRSASRTGFRSIVSRAGNEPARNWAEFPDAIPAIVERLQGVAIECCPALDLVERYDADDALIYVDPPYPFATRPNSSAPSSGYKFELSDNDHGQLLQTLTGLRGKVVVSGYDHPIYRCWLDGGGWRRVEKAAYADGARPRVECLWLNAAAVDALECGGAD